MRKFKTLAAIVLSAVMIIGSTVTAFAEEPTTTNGEDASSAGTGQILDFKVVRQVVPTALRVAINPNSYPVNLRYNLLTDEDEFKSGTKYYTVDNGTYSVATDVTADNFDDKVEAGLYTADTSDSQIVTFNYGLANKSTVDRKILVKLDVTADENIEFVSSRNAATAKTTGGSGTAERGEYKIYMTLIPTKAGTTPTTNTYEKATEYAENTDYYSRDESNKYSKEDIADAEAFAAFEGTLYKTTTTIGTEILASELGDITMDESTAPIAFAAGTGTTYGDVAYSLPESEWSLNDDAYIDFDTTASEIGSKFSMTGIGGVSGFTIAGTMNTTAEWSQLTTKTITITPTYAISDSTGTEVAVETGLNQVETEARTPEVVPLTVSLTSNSVAITGLEEGATLQSMVFKKADGTVASLTEGTHWSYANGTFTVLKDALLGESYVGSTYTLTFSDETTKVVTVVAAE